MPSKSAKILITGLPGCGKTTAIMKIVAGLDREKVVGFYTRELRENDVRKGFRWKRLDGAEGVLAHINIKPHRVGKYGVDIEDFQRSVVSALDIRRVDAELFVIDEIGKMECLSPMFAAAVRQLLASDRSVLASVAQKGSGLIREVKNYPDVSLFNLTRRNRDKTIGEILQLLSFLKRPSG